MTKKEIKATSGEMYAQVWDLGAATRKGVPPMARPGVTDARSEQAWMVDASG
jgi:hypothetical protein